MKSPAPKCAVVYAVGAGVASALCFMLTLVGPATGFWHLALLVGLPMSLGLMLTAIIGARNGPQWARVLCWATWLCGIGLLWLEVRAQGGIDPATARGASVALGLMLCIPVLVGGLLVLGRSSRGIGNHLADAGIGCAVVIALAAGGYGILSARAAREWSRAEQAWAALGMPLASTLDAVVATQENESLGKMMAALGPFGLTAAYKPGPSAEKMPDATVMPEEFWIGVVELLDDTKSRGDLTPTDSEGWKSFKQLQDQNTALSRLYDVLLNSDPPSWTFRPEQGFSAQIPSYLTLRKLTQLFCADALVRLARGDVEGADKALRAANRASLALESDPRLVSTMMRAALLKLISQCEAQLPITEDAGSRLAPTIEWLRGGIISSLRYETWAVMDMVRREKNPGTEHSRFSQDHQGFQRPALYGHLRPVQKFWDARLARSNAAQVGVLQRRENLAADLGKPEFDRIEATLRNSLSPSWFRANARLHGTLLACEQVRLLRDARQLLASGSFRTEAASAVIPGARWVIVGDASTRGATVTLNPLPQWIEASRVFDPYFFPAPLDGSAAWRFAWPSLAEK